MKKNFWQTIFGDSRRRTDKALLASLERDIADGERLAAKNAKLDNDERQRIARAFGRP